MVDQLWEDKIKKIIAYCQDNNLLQDPYPKNREFWVRQPCRAINLVLELINRLENR